MVGSAAFPSLNELHILEITLLIALEVIREIESRGSLGIASRVLHTTKALFRYADQ